MNRRHFVHRTALSGFALYFTPSRMHQVKGKHIGIQLYSVRDIVVADPAGTLAKLSAMGYTEVEGYLYHDGLFHSYPPKVFKKVLSDLGMRMVSMHHGINMSHWDSAYNRLSDAAQKVIDDHVAMGVDLLICPGVDESDKAPESFKRLCEVFNHMGEACKKAGIQFGYHNHEYEFTSHKKGNLMEILLQHTDPALVSWEMDLYWVEYARQDPVHWIRQNPGRIIAFHVKDLADSTNRETAVVGDGLIDFQNIFDLRETGSVKYYIVELEHYTTTSLNGVERSLKKLKQLLS